TPDSAPSITILDVLPGEVAAIAGVRVGDRILAMNGRPAREIASQQISAYMRSSPLVLELDRSGERLTIELRLED
ncbi:MAG: PDZ domain-containing protein, partial [Rhodospirillales bacterium]|nr:PDZ domain-containing protein [Rhodospirillales bacterium]